jgi:hypothetical protein
MRHYYQADFDYDRMLNRLSRMNLEELLEGIEHGLSDDASLWELRETVRRELKNGNIPVDNIPRLIRR